MSRAAVALSIALSSLSAGTAFAQQCLHGSGATPDQEARRREALTATRTINNIQMNQPGSGTRSFIRHADLASAPFAARMQASTNETVKRMSLSPTDDILPGWKLTLDVSQDGYWFMIKDTTDPCGFAFISNHSGLIFNAEPIR